jgi:hypothetical protein
VGGVDHDAGGDASCNGTSVMVVMMVVVVNPVGERNPGSGELNGNQ